MDWTKTHVGNIRTHLTEAELDNPDAMISPQLKVPEPLPEPVPEPEPEPEVEPTARGAKADAAKADAAKADPAKPHADPPKPSSR